MDREIVYLFVFDTLADWEVGYAIAGINNPDFQKHPNRYCVQTVGLTGEPVTTIGGMTILPDLALDEVETSAMLILPGGEAWDEGKNTEILEKAREFHAANIPIAAICGATSQGWPVLAFWMISPTPAMPQNICRRQVMGALLTIKINLPLRLRM
jgi:hypothetical protein